MSGFGTDHMDYCVKFGHRVNEALTRLDIYPGSLLGPLQREHDAQ